MLDNRKSAWTPMSLVHHTLKLCITFVTADIQRSAGSCLDDMPQPRYGLDVQMYPTTYMSKDAVKMLRMQ